MVLPSGIVSTGWPAVRDKSAELGITYDSWQDGTGRAILAKRADGLYAASIGGVVISIPRQVGKTFLIGGITFALCLLQPNLTVIWTAHRLKTAGETFRSMQAMARRKKIKPHVANVYLGSGDEEVRFVNGSRILFGARERGFGLGFSMVDILVLDEAQRIGEATMDDMVPTLNQAPNPLIIMTGTPPRPTDSGEVFASRRAEALAGESDDLVYIEFSADPEADPMDRDQWVIANPSFPARTPESAMLRMRKNLKDDDSFLREGLGVWDATKTSSALSFPAWVQLADVDAERGAAPVFGLDVAEDRTAWVAVAWYRPDGAVQVMLANDGVALPAFRLASESVRLSREWGGVVVPPRAFLDEVERAGATVRGLKQGEFPTACGMVADLVASGSIRHGNQLALNESVKAVRWRSAGTAGERSWKLTGCPEAGPLTAVTRAVFGLVAGPPEPAVPVCAAPAAATARSETGDLLTMSF